jgi:hypothetical protein
VPYDDDASSVFVMTQQGILNVNMVKSQESPHPSIVTMIGSLKFLLRLTVARCRSA